MLHQDSDLQALDHVVYFDGDQKLIVVQDEIFNIDVKIDIYSAWKEWNLLPTRQFNQYEPAIRTIGGDPTTGTQFAGDIYFLINGWRLQRDPRVALQGALFSDDFATPSIDFNGNDIGLSVVSSLVTSIAPSLEGLSIPTVEQIVAGVWDELLSEHLIEGSAGLAAFKALTVSKFLALK